MLLIPWHNARGILLPLTLCFFFVSAEATTALASESAGGGEAENASQAASEKAVASAKIDFARQVLPILSDKCFVCHGPDAEQLDLNRLDSLEAATEDLGGYRAIDPQEPSESQLLTRIESSADPMPPVDAEKQLSEPERQLLKRWVLQGGEYATHWAFVPPGQTARGSQRDRNKHDPSVRSDSRDDWEKKSSQEAAERIDELVLRRLEVSGVSFAKEAEGPNLARRAALVLTGLPPEQKQLEQFLQDDAPNAYAKYVDELLESPRFGEHQARYWLDAVRYGDTHGLHLDNRRGIYPYRDWVVRAFNRNLPLDDFLVWQLAGDLLPSPSLEQQVATGFVRMNPSTSEGGAIAEEFQAKNSFDRTETFGTVLLGLSLTCARCHTHKYDPITHTEYYQLFAFFNNTKEPPLDGNRYDYGSVAKVPSNQASWARYERLRSRRTKLMAAGQKWLARSQQLIDLPALEDIAEAWRAAEPRERLSMLAEGGLPMKRDGIRNRAIRLVEQFDALEADFTTTLVAQELEQRRATHVLTRGEYDKPIGEALQPDIPSILGQFPENLPRNRLGLAKWLVSADNPLTARVLVNRIWQRVFGHGLVRTPEDFGVQGQQATHPELLDWLAVELQESGWDLKHMLRSMVLSDTFRQSARWRDSIDDPENLFYARGPSYRLDAEVIRDIGLWASGLLDPQMGGQGVKPYQPDGMWQALAHPASNTKLYERDQGNQIYRRSLYLYWKRTSPHPMMTLFDAPDRESSCVRRSRTNTSLQSLALFNETQRLEIARKFAERAIREDQTDAKRIRWMFERLGCRQPNSEELKTCLGLLEDQRQRFAENVEDAVRLTSVGDAAVAAGIPPEEIAAWTQLAVTLLASDIAILLY